MIPTPPSLNKGHFVSGLTVYLKRTKLVFLYMSFFHRDPFISSMSFPLPTVKVNQLPHQFIFSCRSNKHIWECSVLYMNRIVTGYLHQRGNKALSRKTFLRKDPSSTVDYQSVETQWFLFQSTLNTPTP